MNQKLLSKVLATTLAVTLTLANFVMLGMYATKSYATEDALESQTTVSNNENVSFDAYFMRKDSGKIHTSKQDIDESTKLYLAVNVEKGYLKNAKIEMLGQDGKLVNFKILNNDNTFEAVENIDVNTNTISLKQINTGTGVVLEVPIASIKENVFDLSNFDKINNITLTGSYVSDSGKNVQIQKTISTRVKWEKQVEAEIKQEGKTVTRVETTEFRGQILQTIIRTGLVDNALPIKETKITVNAVDLAGKKPTKVTVIANNTYATNGKDGTSFGKENWNYDEKTGIITITVSNEANNNKVAWNKNVKDEYIITYVYPDDISDDGFISFIRNVQQHAQVEITSYSSEQDVKGAEDTITFYLDEKGSFVDTQIEANEALGKGYLYTNSEKEIEYFENVKLAVGYADIVTKMELQQDSDVIVDNRGNVYPVNENSYYKTTKINKNNLEKILGQTGNVKIIGADGNLITEFGTSTPSDENGNIVYTYPNEVSQIKIETSQPITEGTLLINHVKSLKGKTGYTKEQISNFEKLKMNISSKTIYLYNPKHIMTNAKTLAFTEIDEIGVNQEVTLQSTQAVKEINLVDPVTKLEVEISKPNLSTVVKNEDVEIRVILKTNDITCDLYKKPEIEVELPSYVSELKVKNIQLLFDNELSIKENGTYVKENGNTVIRIVLDGEQTTYNQNDITKGANIVINTDMTLNKLTPTTDDVIKAYVTNKNVTTYEREVEEKGYAETPLKAVAPTGIVTINEILNYNKNQETVTSISGEEKVGKLETNTNAKNATVKMNVINNYNNIINDISILGRIPFAGNKNVVTNEDLGSNLNTILNSGITSNIADKSKVIIYYSSNPDATKDLQDANNNWVTDITDLSNIKSYLIVLKDYEMNTGDTIEFSYGIQIPANLTYDLSTYATYTVYFNNVKENEIVYENVTAPKVGLTTEKGQGSSGETPGQEEGQKAQLAVEMKANAETVKERDIITYTVAVKNSGKTQLNNVTVTGSIPTNTVYTYIDPDGMEGENVRLYDNSKTNYSEKIASIAPGETKEITYEVEAKQLENNVTENEIVASANVTVEGYEGSFASNEVKTKLVQGNLKINLSLVQIPEAFPREVKEEVIYEINVTNVTTKAKEDIVITQQLSDGVTFKGASQNGTYNKETNTVTWNLGMIKGNVTRTYYVTVETNELPEKTYQRTISSKVIAKNNDFEVESNKLDFQVKKGILTVKQTSETKKEVSEGSNIIYNVVIENIGAGTVTGVKISNIMSEGLEFEKAQYSVNGKTTYGSDVISLSGLNGGERLELTVYLKAKELPNGKDSLEVKNVVKVQIEGQDDILSNEITNIVVKNASSGVDPSTPENPEEGTHSITGIVWEDTNSNGKRDEGELGIDNVTVILINSEDGKIVKDITTGRNKEQKTVSGGEYAFSNLRAGKYMVVFLYDTEKYGITEYKKEGVNDNKNSDAISLEVQISGKKQLAGVSDKLSLSNEDINNIDIGLVENPKFDLKLDKVITKITTQENQTVKEYSYKDSKFAKLDLNQKTINNTTIIVEYKIRVTNEGEVAGYAKKIVDYLPKDMKFSSELNPEWYQSSNGNVYNASLANTLINPGETKEVTLLLTKKMDENNLGVINNTAEIYESSNDLGLQDVDSTPANKVQNEDDISSADAMIGVKTGEIYVYITITVISIGILAVGIYYIKKKVLGKI